MRIPIRWPGPISLAYFVSKRKHLYQSKGDLEGELERAQRFVKVVKIMYDESCTNTVLRDLGTAVGEFFLRSVLFDSSLFEN